MKLDIEGLEEYPTNVIAGFQERLEKLFPGMWEHRCSEGKPGGFFNRVREGTWMGHVVEHIALEIQTLAGMDCGFGRTRGSGEKGIYNIFFSYEYEEAGRFAARAAVRIAEALVTGTPYNVEADIIELQQIKEEESLGVSTAAIVKEAEKRNIPYFRMNSDSRLILGQGVNQKRVQASIASTTSVIGVDIASDKEETKHLLRSFGITVPDGTTVYGIDDLLPAIEDLGFPLVIKPLNSNHGKGASINIKTIPEAVEALNLAKKFSKQVLVEKFITGHDFRMLVINYKLVAVAKRTPASVTGDGVSTIQQLIDRENTNPMRGEGHQNILTKIKVDENTLSILKKKGYTLESVPARGELLNLKSTANLSTGGTATDVTDLVHPHNVLIAESIARIIGLDICGIDVVAPDVHTPIAKNGGAVIEVNAAPGLRMHLHPSEGSPRNVAEPIVDMLFPAGSKATIPVIAVTGTNGKTTTTRLIAHMAKTAGYRTGFITTDGIYINDRTVMTGDCTGPVSAETVLKDPGVELAVLECARGGILRSGLGFSTCDIGIVTNVSDDHIGLNGINSLEDMAKVKAVIPETVSPDGYAVLNADDDRVFFMKDRIKCKIALFSMDDNNVRILEHLDNGGIAAIVKDGHITLCSGKNNIRIEKVEDIPLTFSGKASFMTQNVLAAVLGAYLKGIKAEDIKLALQTFIPSPKLTPGRVNLFKFENFQVMLDYAHNPAGMEALSQFLQKLDARPKVGVIAAVGDRRDEDIVKLGMQAAKIFDELIIRLDDDLRGRDPQALIDLLQRGIQKVSWLIPVKVIPNTSDAIMYAIENARPGSFVTIFCEKVVESINLIKKCKKMDGTAVPVPVSNLRKAI